MRSPAPFSGSLEPALRLRDLGEDVVALGRKPFCGLGYIAFGDGQSYAINEAVPRGCTDAPSGASFSKRSPFFGFAPSLSPFRLLRWDRFETISAPVVEARTKIGIVFYTKGSGPRTKDS
jgi:hypothetical protein